MASRLSVFLSELKRRKVYRVAIVYVIVGVGILGAAEVILDPLGLDALRPYLVILVLLGFPAALVLAWAYEVKPEEPREAKTTPLLAVPQGPVIAVLPFTNMSGDLADEFFTDGITEDIITGLSRFTHLFVLARNTTFQYKGQAVDVRELQRDLGAQYVLEGGIRKAADHLRVSVQLLEGRTGTHLWAETYDRDLTAGEVFAVQDEITSQVVATIADAEGVVTRSAAPEARSKPTDSLDAYEAVLRAFSYWAHQSPREHADVRAALERAVEVDPGYSHAWACLSLIYLDELRVGFNPLPDPGRRIMESARRAAELGPDNPLAFTALASAQYFSGDLDGFFASGERAIRLNPNDSTALATMGMLTAFGGEWEWGVAMLKKAIALNPGHPGWYNLPLAIDALRRGDDEKALREALRINMPGYYPAQMVLTAAYGHMGRDEDARAAAATLLQVAPDFVEDGPRRIWGWQHDPVARSRLLEGLRKAGLDVHPPEPLAASPSSGGGA